MMAHDLEHLVRQRYRPDEGWLTLDEVGDSARRERRLDLIAVGCWPSNGMHLIGFEVKRTVADFRRELDQPGKRASFVDQVNEFVFVAPWDVIKPAEIPEGCGLLSADDSGKLKMRVRAKQRKCDPSSALLTCLFRAALRQIEDVLRSQQHYAEWRGRSLSFADVQALAKKAGEWRDRSVARDVEAADAARRDRQQLTQAWGNVLRELWRLGRDLSGVHVWSAKDGGEAPLVNEYRATILAAIEKLRAANRGERAKVAEQLREIASRLEASA